MGIAAVGRIAEASFVVVVSFLTSLTTILGILDARKDALSRVRMTWIEEAMCCSSDGFRGIYLGWIEDIVIIEFKTASFDMMTPRIEEGYRKRKECREMLDMRCLRRGMLTS